MSSLSELFFSTIRTARIQPELKKIEIFQLLSRRSFVIAMALLHQYEKAKAILASPHIEGCFSISRHSYPA
jgi:hypothetical protein